MRKRRTRIARLTADQMQRRSSSREPSISKARESETAMFPLVCDAINPSPRARTQGLHSKWKSDPSGHHQTFVVFIFFQKYEYLLADYCPTHRGKPLACFGSRCSTRAPKSVAIKVRRRTESSLVSGSREMTNGTSRNIRESASTLFSQYPTRPEQQNQPPEHTVSPRATSEQSHRISLTSQTSRG